MDKPKFNKLDSPFAYRFWLKEAKICDRMSKESDFSDEGQRIFLGATTRAKTIREMLE